MNLPTNNITHSECSESAKNEIECQLDELKKHSGKDSSDILHRPEKYIKNKKTKNNYKTQPEKFGQRSVASQLLTQKVAKLPEEFGVNEGFTDSETDDSIISSESLYEYIDFIPEPTTFRGRRIGLIQDISEYP